MSISIKAFILISFFLALPARGAHLVTTGTFVPYFNKAQISNTGATRKFELNPYVGYGQQFHISGPHYFMPEIALAFYLDNAKKTTRRTLFLHYDFSYVLTNVFLLRYGLTTYWHTIEGEGGTVTLRNGDSYSDFKAPSKARTSYYTTVDFGGEYFFNPVRSLRLDVNMMNARDFENRAFNYILSYNWYL